MSEVIEPVAPVAAVKPRRAKRVVEEPVMPEYSDLLIATDSKDEDDWVLIRLHDSEDMPPTGQPFGVNGRFFVMGSNRWYRIPEWLLSTIDNCVVSRPIQNDQMQFIGTRNMKRFPYEIYRG